MEADVRFEEIFEEYKQVKLTTSYYLEIVLKIP
ncbi:Uncharacterised protein [Streptococcus pneumoniae]|nr:Uncharacterised protein [Streptococcus pneumoniae]